MPREPRSIRLPLLLGGVLVAALVGVLWWSLVPRDGAPGDSDAEPILPRGPAPTATHEAPANLPAPNALEAAPTQPLEAPVVALGPNMIAVRVLDADTRQPVTAYTVSVLPHDGTPPLPRANDRAARTDAPVPVHSQNGLYKVDRAKGQWDVVVQAAEYQPATAEVPVPALDNKPVDILLSHGPSLTGLVYDDDGLPVQDVPVFLSVERGGDGVRATVARTGRDGRFRFSPLTPGVYGIALLDPNNRNDRVGNLNVEQGTTDISIYLAPRHNIVINVHDRDGRPVAGAQVALNSGQGSASARTEASGQARLRYLADGVYDVSISGDGFESLSDQLVLEGGSGEQLRWFTLQPAPGG
jgi:hypothetical protein